MISRRRFLVGASAGVLAGPALVGGRGPKKRRTVRVGDRITLTEMVTITRSGTGGGGGGALYPPDTALQAIAVNGDARPGFLADPGLIDSTWGTEIRRLTNINNRAIDYPRHQVWNKDGTRIFLQGLNAAGTVLDFRFLDGVTYADLGNHASGSDYPMWSNTDADKMYGPNGPNLFRRFSVATDSWTTIRTFTGYDSLGNGNEGNISDDDHCTAVSARNVSTGRWEIIRYDPVADTFVTRDVGTSQPNNCSVSRSGQFVIVAHGVNDPSSGTADTGTWLYRASDLAPRYQLSTVRPHMDPGRDISGNDILVHVAASGTGVVSTRLLDQTTRPADIFLLGGMAGSCHVSCTNYDRPGWAYLSRNQSSPGIAGNEQLVAVKTDGSGTVQIFGFHHANAQANYNASPHASASRDGSKVIFRSRWDGLFTEVYCFVAGMAV